MQTLPLSLPLAALLALTSALAAAPGASHPLSAKERAELLPVICPDAVTSRGCSRCPPGTSEAGEAEDVTATAVTYGHYLKAGQTAALVDLAGCEAHVTNFGATALLRWEGLTRWTLLKVLPGYRTDRCVNFTGQDGRDRSVCEGYYANMGIEVSWLALTDWTRPDDARNLLSVESNVESCMGSEVHDLRLVRWSRQGPRLVAQVSEARGRIPAGWQCGDPVKLPRPRTVALSWRWNGASFMPAPSTRQVLPRIQAQP